MIIYENYNLIKCNDWVKFAALLGGGGGGGGGATTLEMFPSWPIRTHQTLPTVPFLLL